MPKNCWIVSGCFALALALPVRAFDTLDDIKADLANCKNCPHRTLIQARLNLPAQDDPVRRDWNIRDRRDRTRHKFGCSAGHGRNCRLNGQQRREWSRRKCASPGG